MGDMFILIFYQLRLNLVYFDLNRQTNCKKGPIVIDYNGHNVKWHWNNNRYFDDVIMTSRRETQMGDKVIFI